MVAKKKEPVNVKVHKKTVKKQVHEVKEEKHKKKSNKVLLISLIAVAVILVIAGVAVYMNKDKLFDKVVATVNGEKIFLKEVNSRYALYQGSYTKIELLNQTVIERLLLQEAAKKNIEVSDEEFNKFLDSLLQANSMTKDQLMQEIKKQNIEYSEFEKSYKQRILIEKLIADITKDIQVSEQDVLAYYELVKSQIPENVTFAEVQPLINQTVMAQKQNQAFSDFMDNLFAKSNIVINSKLVEDKPATEEKLSNPDKLVNLAKCLTEKGTIMYGASWCGHCANQKAMFGDAFQYVTYVECDTTGKEACDAAGVQAYPTWFINGEKQEGEIPLETLAGVTGCSY
jgi:hypothetical protein